MLTICVAIAANILAKSGYIWQGVAAMMMITVLIDAMLFGLFIYMICGGKFN